MDKKYGFLFLAMLAPTVLSGCSSEKVDEEAEEEENAGEIQLHILNVEDYIAEDEEDEDTHEITYGVETLFEAYCKDVLGKDVNVVYETTDTPETMLMLLQTGKYYDLICPSDYMIQRMGREGLIEPLDLSLVSTEKEFEYKDEDEVVFEFSTGDVDNYTNYSSRRVREYLDNCFLDQKCYEGKDAEYIASHPLAIGYMWGTLGILFNPTYGTFEEEDTISDMQSWDAFWNETYKNKSSVKDSMRDTFAVGVIHKYYEDFELNGVSKKGFKSLMTDYREGNLTAEEYNAEIDKIFNMDENYVGNKKDVIYNVLDDLHELKKNIRGLEVDTGKNDIVNGYIGVNCAWSGDAVYSMEQAEEEKELELYYSIPNTGSNLWMDAWCMPKSSLRSEAQKELAELFLDFLSIPEYTAQNMDYTGYTPFTAGNEILDLTREWYDYRYDEETEEFDDTIPTEEEIAELGLQRVDLSYFFEGTLTDEDGNVIDDPDAYIFYSDCYLPYAEVDKEGNVKNGNRAVGREFFCQFPDEYTLTRCAVMRDFGPQNEAVLKMWEKFKSDALPVWAIVLFIVEVSAALALVLYFVIGKRMKYSLRKKRKEEQNKK